jgi:hypothetical protein
MTSARPGYGSICSRRTRSHICAISSAATWTRGLRSIGSCRRTAEIRAIRVQRAARANLNGLNMLDSSASAQARIAVEAIRGGNGLFSPRWVPRYLDTDPPGAAVGWMETDANEAGFKLEAKSETVRLSPLKTAPLRSRPARG